MATRNKRAEQIAAKKKHLASQKKANRRKEPLLQREKPTQNIRPTILIACEGINTEPSYFRQFKLSSADIIPLGVGYNTLSLVNKAISLSKEKEYDQIWCVFDADPKLDNPKQALNFNAAIKRADANGIGVAYSNQAFEYWIILHLEDHQGGGMPRTDYHDKINKLLKPFDVTYEGTGCKEITEEIFDCLFEKTSLAIRRAEKIYDKLDHSNPAIEESSTTVFKLVEEILKYI